MSDDKCCGPVGHTLVQAFHIDDGELDGVEPPMAFVLGVQFEQFRQELLSCSGEFDKLVGRDNVERVLKMCWNNQRVAAAKDTSIHEWVNIHVKPKTTLRLVSR